MARKGGKKMEDPRDRLQQEGFLRQPWEGDMDTENRRRDRDREEDSREEGDRPRLRRSEAEENERGVPRSYDRQRFHDRYEDRAERSRHSSGGREFGELERDEEPSESPRRRMPGEDFGSEREFRGAFRRGARDEDGESFDIESYNLENGERATSARRKSKAAPVKKTKPSTGTAGSKARKSAKRKPASKKSPSSRSKKRR